MCKIFKLNKSGNSNETDRKPRSFLLVCNYCFIFLLQVFSFQEKVPLSESFQLDTGNHSKLFLSSPNSFSHQVPTSANPEYFEKPSLFPLPQLGPFLFSASWHSFFTELHSFVLTCHSPIFNSMLCHHSDLGTSDCYILYLKCSNCACPLHTVCVKRSFRTQHTCFHANNWMSPHLDSSDNIVLFYNWHFLLTF